MNKNKCVFQDHWANTQNQGWPRDNQEVPHDRNQFLEPHQNQGPQERQVEDEVAPPPGLDRLVTGQLNEQEVIISGLWLDLE